MIDDIVEMIFKEARARDPQYPIDEIKEVMRILQICVDQAVSVHLAQHPVFDRDKKPSHQWRFSKDRKPA